MTGKITILYNDFIKLFIFHVFAFLKSQNEF